MQTANSLPPGYAGGALTFLAGKAPAAQDQQTAAVVRTGSGHFQTPLLVDPRQVRPTVASGSARTGIRRAITAGAQRSRRPRVSPPSE